MVDYLADLCKYVNGDYSRVDRLVVRIEWGFTGDPRRDLPLLSSPHGGFLRRLSFPRSVDSFLSTRLGFVYRGAVFVQGKFMVEENGLGNRIALFHQRLGAGGIQSF